MAALSVCVGLSAVAGSSVVTQSSLLAWAEKQYPEYFGGGGEDQVLYGYPVRYYRTTGNYIGFVGDDVYVLGPITDGEPLRIGTLDSFVCQVYPGCGVSAPATSGRYATQGAAHEILKTWGGSQAMTGKVVIYNHNANGTTGDLFQKTTDSCSAQIESDGSISYTANGQTIHYLYEDTGVTLSTSTTRLRLYPLNSANGAAAENNYVELSKDSEYYRVVMDGAALEQGCASASVYDSVYRFPYLDGRLAGAAGTWRGRVKDQPVSSIFATTPKPSYAKVNASCDVSIDSAGEATVTIDGVVLPTFTTTDMQLDQKTISTVFSNNPLLMPSATYALQYPTTGFTGVFTVYVSPMSYIDLPTNVSFSSDWMISCLTTRQ